MGLKEKLGLLLLAAVLSLPAGTARAAPADEIANQLICQCGCYAVLSNCVHGECMVRDAMTTLIEQKLAQGQTQEQIIQTFVAQYGEQVLASPPKRGFNLTAWIAPFAAILVGAAVISLAIKKWVRRGEQPVQATIVTKEEEEVYRHRLEKELKKFAERGFR